MPLALRAMMKSPVLDAIATTSEAAAGTLVFSNYDGTALPSSSDYITLNDEFGVSATLTVPGYQAKQFTLYGNSRSYYRVDLTPQ